MQIVKHDIFPTMFILGHRINDVDEPEKVGSIIVKGTFQDMDNPITLPKEEQMPIFLKDTPFNYVRNSDFEGDDINPWKPANGEVEKAPGGEDSLHCAKLTSDGRLDSLTQTLALDKSIGGRTFILSFYAKADSPITINNLLLQAPTTGVTICRFSAELTDDAFQRYVSTAETWPIDESDKEITVILPGSGNLTNAVYFDKVQVEEGMEPTRWDEDTVFRYEHDLVPFKPNADIVIIGVAKPPSEHPTAKWYIVVENTTGLKFEKDHEVFGIDNFPIKTALGWANRGLGDRKSQAGINLDLFNPEERQLPEEFNNSFYNGYDREKIEGVFPVPYLENGDIFSIRSELRDPDTNEVIESNSNQVRLPANRPTTTLMMLDNTGRETEQTIPMNLDTLIIEPETDRYQIVWRGCWPFDDTIKEKYIKLKVEGGV